MGGDSKLGFKKLYEILVVIDDFADQPELHRRTGDGALDTLFIRGRHMADLDLGVLPKAVGY